MNNYEDKRIIVELMCDELYHIYDESGSCIEPDFETEEEALKYATDNGYHPVENFNL